MLAVKERIALIREFLTNKTSELHSANCICKTSLFYDAFRLANVDFFREFYNNILNACI